MMFKAITVISIIVGMASLTGCSTHRSLVKEESVTVERVNSGSAKITRAILQTTKTTLVLWGELRRHFPSRRSIPGHLHIELIGHDGAVFKEIEVSYNRNSIKSRFAKFHLVIPSTLAEISRIRVVHHDAKSHMADSTKPKCRDVTQTKQMMET